MFGRTHSASTAYCKTSWNLLKPLENLLKNESSQSSQIFLSPEKLRKMCVLFNLANDCLLNLANSQNDNYFHSKWSLNVVLRENRCHFVNFLIFTSTYFFLSLRKITRLNSQDFLLRTQNEALRLIADYLWIISATYMSWTTRIDRSSPSVSTFFLFQNFPISLLDS